MKSVGYVVAIIGILVIAAAAIDHFVKHFLGSTAHISLIVGVVGAVVLVIGVVMSMMGGRAKAA
jgi:uncharacterized integral membrane protein